jgi:hypothetical protein
VFKQISFGDFWNELKQRAPLLAHLSCWVSVCCWWLYHWFYGQLWASFTIGLIHWWWWSILQRTILRSIRLNNVNVWRFVLSQNVWRHFRQKCLKFQLKQKCLKRTSEKIASSSQFDKWPCQAGVPACSGPQNQPMEPCSMATGSMDFWAIIYHDRSIRPWMPEQSNLLLLTQFTRKFTKCFWTAEWIALPKNAAGYQRIT